MFRSATVQAEANRPPSSRRSSARHPDYRAEQELLLQHTVTVIAQPICLQGNAAHFYWRDQAGCMTNNFMGMGLNAVSRQS